MRVARLLWLGLVLALAVAVGCERKATSKDGGTAPPPKDGVGKPPAPPPLTPPPPLPGK